MLDLRGKTVAQVHDEIRDILKAEGLMDESFNVSVLWRYDHARGPEGTPWPTDYRWVACFPVTGTSEAHYVHCELLYPRPLPLNSDTRVPIFLAKTFRGWDHAWELAKRLGELLGS